tara:strand:+ start:1333 stop:1602 length:270 start_codon:yes stop_codon:yes gene_type:complete
VKDLNNDCINLNLALAKFLAPRLAYMAKEYTSYPMSMDYDDWKRELLTSSDALNDYIERYDDFATNDKSNKRVDDAMLFVAAHFHDLWD